MTSLKILVHALLVTAITMRGAGASEEEPLRFLNPEVHGFASFGHVRSWGNNWVIPTLDGTNEFWETAGNVIFRPMDHLRVGAQLFARDFGPYDNGRVELDWAYADWRQSDGLGVQVGRVKIPFGLYNEVLDIDSARTTVFLPNAMYSLRARDIYSSIDGAKVYGTWYFGASGSVDYAVLAGRKHLDSDGGTTEFFADQGLGDAALIHQRGTEGAMLQWNTPVAGLAFRAGYFEIRGFQIDGRFTSGLTSTTEVERYANGAFSVIYDADPVVLASEYGRFNGSGETRFDPIGLKLPYVDNSDGVYVSATWRVRSWCDLYAALEFQRQDAIDPERPRQFAKVIAVDVMPLHNWALKLELRDNTGTYNATAAPDGTLEDRWQVLALKTTVDF